jgi:hypothetical protein
MNRRSAPLLLTLVALSACEVGAPRGDSPDRAPAKEAAARNACIAAALAERAHENVETLSAFFDPGQAGTPMAALQFAIVYADHAELRQAAAARVDSAVNHARTPTDSTRYAQAALQFVPRPPEPESLEANVSTAYSRDFQTILANEDHPCNWDL